MRRRIEQWLTGSLRLRIATWVLVMLLFTALCWGLVIRPDTHALRQQQADHAATLRAVEQEQQIRRALDAQLTTAQRNLPALAVNAFSAASVSETSGLALVTWQPQGKQAELIVRGPWQHIPALFRALAGTGVRLNGFELAPGEGALMLTLRLEAGDEN